MLAEISIAPPLGMGWILLLVNNLKQQTLDNVSSMKNSGRNSVSTACRGQTNVSLRAQYAISAMFQPSDRKKAALKAKTTNIIHRTHIRQVNSSPIPLRLPILLREMQAHLVPMVMWMAAIKKIRVLSDPVPIPASPRTLASLIKPKPDTKYCPVRWLSVCSPQN